MTLSFRSAPVGALFWLCANSPMNASPVNISAQEQEQILQTVEMFEVIVAANPQDCQSMEILKDAYQRIGREKDTLMMARKLAETYMTLGQLSLAMLEYEGILQQDGDNPEIIAALGEVEDLMHKAGMRSAPPQAPSAPLDFQAAAATPNVIGTLMVTQQTAQPGAGKGNGARPEDLIASLTDDGNEALGKFLVQHRLANAEVVAGALERVQQKNRDRDPSAMAASLVDEIIRRGGDSDALLSGILDRSKFAYIPLDYYDVDRQIVKMLPESLTLGRLMLPFDLISRTIMIATANPLDVRGKEAVQQVLDYNIQWHLAAPSAIFKVLTETYKIAGTGGSSSGIRLAK